jgi:enediyne polyketide synthase
VNPGIAIVGMACRYAEANTPAELWQNVMDCRRSFRNLPAVRLRREDYFEANPNAPDGVYSWRAAVLDQWVFDREKFGIPRTVYEVTDPVHWLAMEVCAELLGALPLESLRESAGVVVGNTLTGDFSRAQSLRLRWPYARQALLAAGGRGIDAALLARFEAEWKRPFPQPDADSLAGGLSNTIAGRICNQFDLGGGAFVIDGACASSLLAVTQACSALQTGQLDLALAGGVDLSLDPFELVGFARTGALARDVMRVYDARPTGFLPGEGCGFVALMRVDDAERRGLPVLAKIEGWGIATDGAGGMTRPEVRGQRRALQRARRMAGGPPPAFIEGHGTGTEVGDRVEIQAMLAEYDPTSASPLSIGSIKANIGHTKAAAGIAGLIKVVKAMEAGILPPATGVETPHPLVASNAAQLRLPEVAAEWPAGPRWAGVSAFGFGGVDVHLVVRGSGEFRAGRVEARSVVQDAELYVFAAASEAELRDALAAVAAVAEDLSDGERTDLAVWTAEQAGARAGEGPWRAAFVAGSARELAEGALKAPVYAPRDRSATVGFLLPGQGAPDKVRRRPWHGRFPLAAAHLDAAESAGGDQQTAVTERNLAGAALLRDLGLCPDLVVGHSVGEIAAIYLAGCLSLDDARRVVQARRSAMGSIQGPAGGMLAVECDHILAHQLDPALVVAARNGPTQTVLSGPLWGVERAEREASRRGLPCRRLDVADAFHSPRMGAAIPRYSDALSRVSFQAPQLAVYSTITGRKLGPEVELGPLLSSQLVAPVLFSQALAALPPTDLLIEVGPGQALSGLAAVSGLPALALDVSTGDIRGLLNVAARAWILGCPLDLAALTRDRCARPYDPMRARHFLANPCGATPTAPLVLAPPIASPRAGESAAGVVRRILARHTDLSPDLLTDGARLLEDLHLNSLTIGRLTAEAAQTLGLTPPLIATELARATVAELVAALERPSSPARLGAAGVRSWARLFVPHWRRVSEWSADLDSAPVAETTGPGAVVHVTLDDADDWGTAKTLLTTTREFAARGSALVVSQADATCAGFLRSAAMEYPDRSVVLLDGPIPELLTTAHALLHKPGFHRVRVRDGWLEEEEISPWTPPESQRGAGGLPGPSDVILVTGGASGITAICGAELSIRTGARIVVVGRRAEEEVSEGLTALKLRGIQIEYRALDLLDAAAIEGLGRYLEDKATGATWVLHGAALNTPFAVATLPEEELRRTLAVKLTAAERLASALPRLRAFVAFGSIIARTGLDGEAHYALANEWLSAWVTGQRSRRPEVSWLGIEWSAWGGAGMAERMGRVGALAARGVEPLSLGAGVELFLQALQADDPPPILVAASRLPTEATADLPLLRFLEHRREYTPGVELVIDADLDSGRDPWLDDHVVDSAMVVPAVMILELLSQSALGLGVSGGVWSGVRFNQAIVGDGLLTIRACLLASEKGIEAAVRCSSTAFFVDHAVGVLRPAGGDPEPLALVPPQGRGSGGEIGGAYGDLLFQSGRFRRLARVVDIGARRITADLAPERPGGWFASWLPGRMVSGDPGARDALLHAVQLCIPHRRVLPIGVKRIARLPGPHAGAAKVVGVETSATLDRYCWDLWLLDADGATMEVWEGVDFQAVGVPSSRPLPEVSVAAWIERRLVEDLGGWSGTVAIAPGDDRRERRVRATGGVGIAASDLLTDSQGRPIVSDGRTVSISHCTGFTIAISGERALGIDIEPVGPDPRGLLQPTDQALATELGGSPAAAFCVWAAREALLKIGAPGTVPLLVSRRLEDGPVVLASGTLRVVTAVAHINGGPTLAVAVAGEHHEGL